MIDQGFLARLRSVGLVLGTAVVRHGGVALLWLCGMFLMAIGAILVLYHVVACWSASWRRHIPVDSVRLRRYRLWLLS